MREILFRAKAINRNKGYHRTKYKNGDWVYGLLTRLYDEKFENLPAEMINENGVSGIEIDHNTIGQFTGLTDKNGKKIFEGDIVEGHCHSQWSHRLQRCVVEYDIGNFEARHYVEQGGVMRYYSYKVLFSKDVVVIGNIHDNPELLKGATDERN